MRGYATVGPMTPATPSAHGSSTTAIPLVERQLELVRARQKRLAEFADELSDKLLTLNRHRQELAGEPRHAAAAKRRQHESRSPRDR